MLLFNNNLPILVRWMSLKVQSFMQRHLQYFDFWMQTYSVIILKGYLVLKEFYWRQILNGFLPRDRLSGVSPKPPLLIG